MIATRVTRLLAIALTLALQFSSIRLALGADNVLGDVGVGVTESGAHALAGALASASVEPSSGIFQASLTIDVPKARGGAQPQISLTYNSTSGVREAGLGWGLNLPAIERKNLSGPPRYFAREHSLYDYDGNPEVYFPKEFIDQFVFSGMPLVPICVVSSAGCTGHTEPMPDWAVPGTMYFRLENDTLGARFFLWPDHYTWLVQLRGGEILELGRPLVPPLGSAWDEGIDFDSFFDEPSYGFFGPGAPIAHSQRQPFRWNIVRRYDPAFNGYPKNVVAYQWGLRGTRSGRGYLTDVYYTPALIAGDERMLPSSFAHHLRLTWVSNGLRTFFGANTPIWRATPEMALEQVDVASKEDDINKPRAMVRRYHLGYTGRKGRRNLVTYQMEGRCTSAVFEANEILPLTNCPLLPATSLRYSKQIEQLGIQVDLPARVFAVTDVTPGLKLIPLDVNSDGLPDLIDTYIDPDKHRQMVHLNGDGGEPKRFIYGAQLGQPFSPTGYTLTGDLLGNRSTAAYFIVPQPPGTVGQGPFVYSAKPAADGANMVWAPGSGPVAVDAPQWPDQMKLVGDVDGDGLLDRVNWASYQGEPPFNNLPSYALWQDWTKKGYFHTMFSRRYGPHLAGPNDPRPPLNRPLSTAALSQLSPSKEMLEFYRWPSGELVVFLADMDGDSLADLVVIGPNRVAGPQVVYWPGDGRGNFTTCAGTTCRLTWPGNQPLPRSMEPPGRDLSPGRVLLADLNGDGLTDLVAWGKDGIRIFFNYDGVGAFGDPLFLPAESLTPGIQGWEPDQDPDLVRLAAADVNGNGINDLLIIIKNKVWALDLQRNDWQAGPSVPDDDYAPRGGLLVEINNGLGASTRVMYQSTADLYRQSQRAGRAWAEPLPQVMMVVGRVTTVTNLPLEVRSNQQTSYSYDDPAWDGWERRFLGFREVVSTQGDPGSNAFLSTRQTYFIPTCPDGYCGSADTAYTQQRAASGSPLITEIFDSHGRYLSTTSRSYKVTGATAGLDGRSVRFSYLSKIDTRIYDQREWSPFDGTIPFTVEGQEMSWTGAAPIRSRQNVLLRRTQELDTSGRLTSAVDHGQIKDDGGKVDEPIIRTMQLESLRADWRFLIRSVHISPYPLRTAPVVPDDVPRDHRFEYDLAGRLTAAYSSLVGTVPLDRHHEDPARGVALPHPFASHDGEVRIAAYQYDEFNNVVLSIGPAGRCERTVYQAGFSDLPVQQITLGGALLTGLSNCGGLQYRTRLVWDRGLGVVLSEVSPQGATTTRSFDGFGRPVQLNLPDATTGLASAEWSERITYFTAPDGPVQRALIESRTGPGSWRSIWGYVDGLGSPLLSLEEADPAAGDAGTWLVSGLGGRDGLGLARYIYEPWFYSGDPASHPLSLPSTPVTVIDRDSFGRTISVRGPDGVVRQKSSFGALTIDQVDDDGETRETTYDGHGRPIIERRRSGGDTVTTRAMYQVLGEPSLIIRSHSQGPEEVVRWMRHDSLGRLVLNAEPNTSVNFSSDHRSSSNLRSWRYAYDDAGQLVGTSDARGCGKNSYYDRLGRLAAEDYSPCLNSQDEYTPVDLNGGTGAEVWNRYDFAEPGQTTDYGVSSANLIGRLVSHYDRSGQTRYGYDLRDQLIAAAKRLARPDSTAFMLSEDWFRTRTEFDEAGRPVSTFTGADVPQLLGKDGMSDINAVYGGNGRLLSINGSYGSLITSSHRDTLGQPTRTSFGDAAATTLLRSYDNRHRLSAYHLFRSTAAVWSGAAGYTPPATDEPPTTQRDLENLSFDYSAADLPTRIRDLRAPPAWPQGAKPASRAYEYDPSRRVSKVTTTYSSNPTVGDPAVLGGNIAGIPGAGAPSRAMVQAFEFDWQGNTKFTTDDAGAFFDRSIGAITNGTSLDGPNQLRSAGNGSLQARYDSSGNLIDLLVTREACADTQGLCTHRFVYDWDEVGRLVRGRRWDFTTASAGGATFPQLPAANPIADVRFQYDAGGQRVIKSIAAPGGARHTVAVFPTLRLEGATFDIAAGNYERTPETEVVVIPNIGRVIYRAGLPAIGGSDQHVLFEFGDPLGSVGTVIDKVTGELVQRTTYQPYGGADSDYRPARWGGLESQHRFTGQEEDAEVGLVHFNARYYHPSLGRWISPDPLGIHGLASDPNVYAYVSGAISIASDPTGMQACIGFEMCGPSGGGSGNGTWGFQIGFGKPDGASPTQSSTTRPSGTPNRTPPPPPRPADRPANAGWLSSVGNFARTFAVNASPVGLAIGLAIDPEQTLTDVIMPRAELVVGLLGMNYSHVDGPIHHRPDIDGEAAIVAASLVPGPGALSRLGTLERGVAKAEGRALSSSEGVIPTSCVGPECPCFGAGTVVSTPHGDRPIEALREGDEVLSRDDETGEIAPKKIIRTLVTPDAEVFELAIQAVGAPTARIIVTPAHPFWVQGRGWTAAAKLRPHDELFSARGLSLRVVGSKPIESRQTVYNLEVERFHTYFVGEVAAWAHNTCTVYAGRVGPGQFADKSIPLEGPQRNFRTDQYRSLMGEPCHSCGTYDYGTVTGYPVIDHQPPVAFSPNGPFRGFPQCTSCGLVGGGANSQPHEILRILRITRVNAPPK